MSNDKVLIIFHGSESSLESLHEKYNSILYWAILTMDGRQESSRILALKKYANPPNRKKMFDDCKELKIYFRDIQYSSVIFIEHPVMHNNQI